MITSWTPILNAVATAPAISCVSCHGV